MISKIFSGLGSERGGAISNTPWETSLLVLVNVFYDKKREYIWFRGGDLKGFGDIKPFTN